MNAERNSSNSNILRSSTPSPIHDRPLPDAPSTSHAPGRHDTGAATARRTRAERLMAVAPHLPSDERALIHQVYGDGRSATEVARLTGDSPRAVRARLARITTRVDDPLFAWVVVHERALPPLLRAIAKGNILHHRPLRDVARERGLSYHQARALRQSIVSLAQARIVSAAAIAPSVASAPDKPPPGSQERTPRTARRPKAHWRSGDASPQTTRTSTTTKGDAP